MSPVATHAAATVERVWKALPPQAVFLRDDETEEILYGGAKGGGKSDGLLIFSIRRRTKYPGSSGLIIRREFADLVKEGALIPRSKELLTGIAQYHEQHHKWRFPKGSVIEFGHAKSEHDILGYQGAQYDDICVDQLEQFTEWQYRILHSAARTTRKDLKPLMRTTANPGDVGHAWVKAYFVDVVPPRTPFVDPETGLTRMFIPATLRDNPHLNREYIQWLQSLPEPWRSAWVDGRWDVFVGQYFSPWQPRAPHVCEPFDLPLQWPRWMAYDWGSASPAWWGWFCRAPWGTIYLYRELYHAIQEPQSHRWVGTGLTVDRQAAAAKGMMLPDEVAAPCYAGGDVFTRSGQTGETNADVAARAGISMVMAMTNRVQGWQRLKRAFQSREVDRLGVTIQEPELVIFSLCTHIIRTLPTLAANPHDMEDISEGQEDHPADGARYGMSTVFAAATTQPPVVFGPPRATTRIPW